MSGKVALVTLVPEDQQMNDTINILPHTTCQPTTSKEDIDMVIRRERETALSPEPDAMSEVEEGNIEAYMDPNPYTVELLDLKREETSTAMMQDPDLERVLNKVCAGLTVEDRILELKLRIEGDQTQRREEKKEEWRGPSITTMQLPKDRVIPDSTENSRECLSLPAMSECFYTTPTEERQYMTIGTMEEAAETLARGDRAERAEKGAEGMNIAISEKPSRDLFVVGNSPICNLGASGVPLDYSQHGDIATSLEPSPASLPVKGNEPVHSRGASNQPEDRHDS
ncbi:hypothetical protein L211DRAFT_854259 [Terfezia boudieri ATCC MYA-4762]|uniref:Uncharacterized protein n=1 Tax=Terfezia boudieri ATCC MYA-4762 TaxID=1051890 RepID=A0A3N4L6T6_9PEZI|nr:hypothetical protein L211DRAFT_854259 [Terfezia boudieri ATCC MYA-4762]